MAYPSRDDLVAASSQEALTSLSQEEQDDLRGLAIAAIEDFCGQSFTGEDTTRTIDGTGGRTLPLDRRLAELTSISVQGSSIDASDLLLNERHDELSVSADASMGNWYTRAIRDDVPPMFTGGAYTVEIEGIWGWLDTEIPDDDLATPVAQALRRDMEDQALAMATPLADSARALAKVRMPSMNEGPLSVRVEQGLVPLSSEVMQLLRSEGGRFIWHPIGRTW